MSEPVVGLYLPQLFSKNKYDGPVAIDINGVGEVIAVQLAKDSKHFLYWTGQAVFPAAQIEWIPQPYTIPEEHAGNPYGVAMNNKGDVVLVWERLKNLYYQIGKVSGAQVIWQSAVNYDKDGGYPSVAINDQGVVMAVHYSQTHPDTVHAYIGVLDASNGVIDGFTEHYVSTADEDTSTTSVALNNNNQAIVYFTFGPYLGVGCYYVAGTVDVEKRRFIGGPQRTWLVSGTYGTIGLGDNGAIVEVHQPNLLSTHFEYSTGELSADSKKIVNHSDTAKGYGASLPYCGMSTFNLEWLVVAYITDDGTQYSYTVLGGKLIPQ